MLIKDFTYKKVADFLRDEKPSRVLLIFWHGLGDVLMFIPQIEKLKSLFPDTRIDIGLEKDIGFQCLFEKGRSIEVLSGDHPIDSYDYTFYINYWMAEGMQGTFTKSELSCALELGIYPASESHPKLDVSFDPTSKRIGCCFQSTALPDMMNCPEAIAEKIWNEIIEAGFEPFETTMRHKWFNPCNAKYNFVGESHCRETKATVPNLIQFLSTCFANISVSTGNLHLALSMDSERTLYLKRAADIGSYTREKIIQVDVNQYHSGFVHLWIDSLASEP